MRRTLALLLIPLLLPVVSYVLPYRTAGYGPARAEQYAADCRIAFDGSRVSALCHNPNAWTDRVRLHIECDSWWDIDTDTRPTDVAPARTAEVSGRCWQQVRSAWVSHENPEGAPPPA
ncbi:hypothetical protein [Streptomyces sp. NPDC060194]|uniref:hypothetical protein n=1 Tax=Streptomyces sp. NPDC060194 TaxID=3347069 RepID=UPI003665583F